MNRTTLVRTGIAATVAGLGLAVGGIAVAGAQDTTTTTAAESPVGPRGGPGAEMAATLAKALGLDEDKVATALRAVREDLRPEKPADGTRPTPPSDEERAARQEKLAAALAKELDVSKAKVTAALEKVEEQREADRAERRTEARAALVEKLDAAVKAGTLTSADRASVLKAFDAKIIGGGPGGPGGPEGRGGPGGPRGADAPASEGAES